MKSPQNHGNLRPETGGADHTALALLSMPPVIPPSGQEPPTSPIHETGTGSNRLKILIVDDSASNRKLLRISLEAEGFRPIEAADGIEALEVLARERVDGIVSDILMPRMDGYRLCQTLRQSALHSRVPVILATSMCTCPSDARLARHCGADKYFTRPVKLQSLVSDLKKLCQTGHQPRRSTARKADKPVVRKESCEALVRKLEKRNSQLERAHLKLRNLNQNLQEGILARTKELEAANAELGAFNHSVAHDLRSPLTAVLGYTQLLQSRSSQKLDAEENQFVGEILQSARRMDNIVRSLLSLSESNQAALGRQRFQVSECVQRILQKLKEADPGREATLTIEPDLWAEADLNLMQLALENLLDNAWKYTGRTGHTRIAFGRFQKEKESVYFLRDNGAGFDMAQADKLFRPFRRLHLASEFPGNGIGLSIVKRVITRHGGRIWADSQPGLGATFFFTLPNP